MPTHHRDEGRAVKMGRVWVICMVVLIGVLTFLWPPFPGWLDAPFLTAEVTVLLNFITISVLGSAVLYQEVYTRCSAYAVHHYPGIFPFEPARVHPNLQSNRHPAYRRRGTQGRNAAAGA